MRLYFALACAAALLAAGCPIDSGPDPNPNAANRVVDAQLVYPVGAQPLALAIADVNSDGLPDVLAVNEADGTLSVLRKAATGGFALHEEYAAGPGPLALAVADFNNDGAPDAAVANNDSGDLSVLLNLGEGDYGDEARIAAPVAEPDIRHIAAADLDGDGTVDLVTANAGTNTVSVFLGNGDGTFMYWDDLAAGDGPRYVLLLDLNADGRPDIVTANRDSNDLSVFRSNDDGAYDPAVNVPVDTNPRAIAPIDLDHNALPDLVVSNTGAGSLSLLPGAAGGTFDPAVHVPLDDLPTRLAVADFDSDGVDDVACVLFSAETSQTRGAVAVLAGDGAGGLGSARVFGAGKGSIDVAAADIRGDSQPDLIVANSTGDNISLLLGRGDGSFETDERFRVGGRPRAIEAGDFNEDGMVDLAVTNLETGDISVLLGDGAARLAPEAALSFTGVPRALALGDLNNNNHTDIVATDLFGGQVAVYLGRGDGTFQNARRASALAGGGGSELRSVTLADFDNDGNLDVAVGNARQDVVAVLLGDGTGALGAATEFSARNFPLGVSASDMDGDGNADVVLANGFDANDPNADSQSPQVRTLFGTGDGALARRGASGPYTVSPAPNGLLVADLNNDGNPDVLTAHAGRNTVNLLRGRGAGRLMKGEGLQVGHSPGSVMVGDIDNDMYSDIVTTNSQNSISIRMGKGDLRFEGFMLFPVGVRPIGGVVADLNGDHHPEIIVANRDDNSVSVLRGNS
ncbi:MAG: FG-GAP repeat domain-containing protein [Candidatus Hydrogenedentota bacterium]